MKRAKLADMTPLERVRWRLLQQRRAALRMLQLVATMENRATRDSVDNHLDTAYARTIIALTKPSWVRSASFDDALRVLLHIAADSPRSMN